ncbi:MAG: hypothetical protein OFPI_24550 [Osedax symbiont Rs2]|nr:MAG: hypothetical protein OFPI_24550 [Osedax symbiont Rs2]
MLAWEECCAEPDPAELKEENSNVKSATDRFRLNFLIVFVRLVNV